jgi:hypothetical protein
MMGKSTISMAIFNIYIKLPEANLWIMGVFPGLMSYQRASRGYQISTSGVRRCRLLLQRPVEDAGGRHRYVLAVQLLDVVGLGWNH